MKYTFLLLLLVVFFFIDLYSKKKAEKFKFPTGLNKVDNDWEFSKNTTLSNEIQYGDGFGITIKDRWTILTKEDSEFLYFNFNMAKDTYSLKLPNTWSVVEERARTKTNYINKNIKIKNWYIIVHPDDGSLIFYKDGTNKSVAITYPYKIIYNYYYIPTEFDKDPSKTITLPYLIFRKFWLKVDDNGEALRIYKYGTDANQFGIRYANDKYEYFNSEYIYVPRQVVIQGNNGRGVTERREVRNVDACASSMSYSFQEGNEKVFPDWNGLADPNNCANNCKIKGMLGDVGWLKDHWSECLQSNVNNCQFAPFRWDGTYGWGVCMNGGERTGVTMCCDSIQPSKEDEKSCDYYKLLDDNGPHEILGEDGRPKNSWYVNCNKVEELSIDTESCNNPYFIEHAEHDQVLKCRNWFGTFRSEPCLNQVYNDKNKDECCKLGFRPRDMCTNLNDKTNDPCNIVSYNQNHVKECRDLGFELCKVDNEYLYNNPVECRQVGAEACNLYKYANENPDECRSLKFEPCNLHRQYLIDNDIECRSVGKEACEIQEFLTNKNRGNPDKCRKINKDYEACKVNSYLLSNSKECRAIDPTKYEACTDKNYMLANSVECRGIDPVKYEACNDPNYMYTHSRECRGVNPKYESCNNNDFVMGHSLECRLEGNPKREACENKNFMLLNSKECRGISTKYEACNDDGFLKSNSKECRTEANPKREACEFLEFRKANHQECRDIDRKYEPCLMEDYLINNSVQCRTLAKPKIEACTIQSYKDTHFDECAPEGYPSCLISNISSPNFKNYCVGSGKEYKVQEEGSFNLADKVEWIRNTWYDDYRNKSIYIKFSKVYSVAPKYILLYFGESSIAWYYGKVRAGFYKVIYNSDPNGFTIDVLNTLQSRLIESQGNGGSYITFDRSVSWYAVSLQGDPAGQILQPENCKEGVWSNWSECEYWKTDGDDRVSYVYNARTRKRYGDVQSKYGGVECTKNVEVSSNGCPYTVQFEDPSIPISTYTSTDSIVYKSTENLLGSPPADNCIVSDWSEWSACDGSQQRTRTRSIIRQPSFGGAECPTELTQTETNTEVCPLPSFYLKSKQNNGYCLGGQNRESPRDGGPLAFQDTWNCHRFIQDGSRIKSQSDPSLTLNFMNNGEWNDQALFYTRQWPGDFRMNDNGTIQRLGYGDRCVHPSGGWPGNNIPAISYEGCDDGDRVGFYKEYRW